MFRANTSQEMLFPESVDARIEDSNDSVSISKMKHYSTVTLREDGIVHVDLRLSSLVDYEVAAALFNEMKNVGGGQKRKYLFTVTEFLIPDSEVRSFLASRERLAYTIADAFVLQSVNQVLVAKMYFVMNKPPFPTKYFKEVNPAVLWLQSQI